MKMVEVRLKSSYMVNPDEPTYNGSLSLSELEQTGPLGHVPAIYFYSKPSKEWLTTGGTNTMIETLRASLSKVLVHFYPLAGRLRRIGGNRFELDCNTAGVRLIEAESEATLDDLGDYSPSPKFGALFPSLDYNVPVSQLPLVVVQLTSFRCGGLSLTTNIMHIAADGLSSLHFLSEWARVARGEPLAAQPFVDKKLFRVGEPARAAPQFDHTEFKDVPYLIGQSSDDNERKRPTSTAMLKLTKTQVETLKNKANKGRNDGEETDGRAYSRFESITAHVWRCACKARGHASEQPTTIFVTVDSRRRMLPSLPLTYFGDATVGMIAMSHSGELVSKPLGYASHKIRQAIERATYRYVYSALDFLKSQPDLSPFQNFCPPGTRDKGAFFGNPNLDATSWLTLPIYGLDFGWGEEIYMGPGFEDEEGQLLLIPSRDGDGSLVASLCLDVAHMEAFKKFFYHDLI